MKLPVLVTEKLMMGIRSHGGWVCILSDKSVKGTNRDILYWLCSKYKGKPEGQKKIREVGEGTLYVLFCFSVTRKNGNNLE